MSVMYCYIEPFVINQNVYEYEENSEVNFKEKVPIDNLPEYFAVNAAGGKLILRSSSHNLTEGYAEEIKNYALTKYGLNNIEIEVQ